ncbi:thermonuclease family protein [Hydrogenophaga sp.]|uniref:thermonuclease family protein n=1 Tax=Hydrogenophaga sp. TaxID=1904254 RepID=UPI00286DDC79|nr:thermonuclease family protein [Hydrogenophaga sp.]
MFDGDTLWVQPLDGGRYRKLRLDGLDAPEICQDGGVASRDALAARVLRQVVTVRERSHDDYGRALVRLQHGGDDVGAFMVQQGQAWSYRWRHSEGPFAQEEAQARAQKKGLFTAASPEPPRDFRRRHGPCPMPPRP